MKTIGRNQVTNQLEFVTIPESVWFTTLCQTLRGEPRENPFYGNYGIPAQELILNRALSDTIFLQRTQEQFEQYFRSLSIQSLNTKPPSYQVDVTLSSGQRLTELVV